MKISAAKSPKLVKSPQVRATPAGLPSAPVYLRQDGRELWRTIMAEFDLPKDVQPLLAMACQSWDRMHDARRAIDEHGSTFVDRFQQIKMRPEVLIERDSRLAVAKILRQLNLDIPPAISKGV